MLVLNLKGLAWWLPLAIAVAGIVAFEFLVWWQYKKKNLK